jgi:hypothetical protein
VSVLRFIHESVTTAIQVEAHAKVKIGLLAAVAVECIDSGAVVQDNLLSALVPIILDGLQSDRRGLRAGYKSSPGEFLSAGLLILGQLSSRVRFTSETAANLATQIALATLPRVKEGAVIYSGGDISEESFNKQNDDHISVGLKALVHLSETQSLCELPENAFGRICSQPDVADILAELASKHKISALLVPFLRRLALSITSENASPAIASMTSKQAVLPTELKNDALVKVLIKICVRVPIAPLVPNLVVDLLSSHLCGDSAKTASPSLVKVLRTLEQRYPSSVEAGVKFFLKGSLPKSPPVGTFALLAASFIDPRLQASCEGSDETVMMALSHPDEQFRLMGLDRIIAILEAQSNSASKVKGKTINEAGDDLDKYESLESRVKNARWQIAEALVERLTDDSEAVFTKLLSLLGSPIAKELVGPESVINRFRVVLNPANGDTKSLILRRKALEFLLGDFLLSHPDHLPAVAGLVLDNLIPTGSSRAVAAQIFELAVKSLGPVSSLFNVSKAALAAVKPAPSGAGFPLPMDGITGDEARRGAAIVEAFAERVAADPETTVPFLTTIAANNSDEPATLLNPLTVRARTRLALLTLSRALELAKKASSSSAIALGLWELTSPLAVTTQAPPSGSTHEAIASQNTLSVSEILVTWTLPAISRSDSVRPLDYAVTWLALTTLARFGILPKGSKSVSDRSLFGPLWHPLTLTLLGRVALFPDALRYLLSKVSAAGFQPFDWLSQAWIDPDAMFASIKRKKTRDHIIAQAVHVSKGSLSALIKKNGVKVIDASSVATTLLVALRSDDDAVRAAAASTLAWLSLMLLQEMHFQML